MRTLLPKLKKALSVRKKFELLRRMVYEKPLVWRIITAHFNTPIYVQEDEIKGFFRFAGIRKECRGGIVGFVRDVLEEFQEINRGMLKPSLLPLERKFMDMQYSFKKVMSYKVKYESYYDVFLNAEPEDVEWMTLLLIGQWSMETGVTKAMIYKIIGEVSKVEYENDAVIAVSMMNKNTNQIVAIDMVVKKEILNLIMKEKVHKEFDIMLKETIKKLSTVRNVNKLLYNGMK